MAEWEYWTVTIQETKDRESVMKEALAQGGQYGYQLISVTPVVSSGWDENMFALSGPTTQVRVGTIGYIMIFGRQKAPVG